MAAAAEAAEAADADIRAKKAEAKGVTIFSVFIGTNERETVTDAAGGKSRWRGWGAKVVGNEHKGRAKGGAASGSRLDWRGGRGTDGWLCETGCERLASGEVGGSSDGDLGGWRFTGAAGRDRAAAEALAP
ncbi:hypothetical protein THAOC_25624 [Thalassiosira oceanica]|uniref:Uncharacterized protein n=1 Tax=Thalassiosira oceanica TaxID=159749 RepID=K0RQU3_THAOC|nr:hypothetical protein THAOC_25624 [Thalassiosira oceanica]|eukprot:EJK54724.1 hypothetical protein THAOC_25624 [Thalassiosira oceanica]